MNNNNQTTLNFSWTIFNYLSSFSGYLNSVAYLNGTPNALIVKNLTQNIPQLVDVSLYYLT